MTRRLGVQAVASWVCLISACASPPSPPAAQCFVCVTDADCGPGQACREWMCVPTEPPDAGPLPEPFDAGPLDAGPPDTFSSILGARYLADYDIDAMSVTVDYDPSSGNRANAVKDTSGHDFHLNVNSVVTERPVVLENVTIGGTAGHRVLEFGLNAFADSVVNINETDTPEGGYLAVLKVVNRASLGASNVPPYTSIALASGQFSFPFTDPTMLIISSVGASMNTLSSRATNSYNFTAGELVDFEDWVVVAVRMNSGVQSIRLKGVRVHWNTLPTTSDQVLNRIRIRRSGQGTSDGTLQLARLVVWNAGVTEAEFSRLSQVAISAYQLRP